MDQVDEGRDSGGAVERLARPRGAEVAPLRQVERGAAKPVDGAIFIRLTRPHRAAGAPQRSADAFRRIFEVRLEPAIECLSEQPLGLPFRQHAEERVDARFDGPLAQEIRAKAVNCAHVRFLELLHRALEALDHNRIIRGVTFMLEALAKPELQFTRGLFRERDRDNFPDVRATFTKDGQDAVDQFRRLASARGGFDNDRLVDRLTDDTARVVVGAVDNHAHGRLRSASRSASLSCGLRATRLATSRPQTAMKSHRSQASSSGDAARKPLSIARSMMRSTSSPALRVMSFSGIGCSEKLPADVQ